MTTQRAPDRMDLPPPLTSALSDAGSVVGWVSDDTVGFRGFADETEAMAAAWMAFRTLARELARRHGTRPVPIDLEPLALARDGQRELILASGRSIATLIRPGDDSRSGPVSFGFELQVPASRDAARIRSMAFLLYRTLRRSGIRWAMWRPDDRGDARPRTGAAPGAAHAPGTARDDVHERPARAGGRVSEPSARDVPIASSTARRRVAGVTAVLAVIAVAILLPLRTTTLVVTALAGIAALAAAATLIAIVRLVATDVWTDVRQAFGRRARQRRSRATRRPAWPTAAGSQLGRHLRAYHLARRAR